MIAPSSLEHSSIPALFEFSSYEKAGHFKELFVLAVTSKVI